jgi:hypothetical protein
MLSERRIDWQFSTRRIALRPERIEVEDSKRDQHVPVSVFIYIILRTRTSSFVKSHVIRGAGLGGEAPWASLVLRSRSD